VTSSYFGPTGAPSETRAYTYDADSNRTEVTESGVPFYYFYDATDALITKNSTDTAPSAPTSCTTLGFCYDAFGDLTTSSPGAPDSNILVPTTYTYDAGGHLLTIADGNPAHTVVFVLDALSRNASQAVGGGSATTYAYLGTSDTVSSMSQGTTVTTTSLIDAIGDRIGGGTSAGLAAYLVADLHGNIVAALSAGSTPTLLSAYRYDAYGETCGAWSADSGSIAVPWRFQGRLLESASGATDLYDFAARSYDPSLGAFTSFDSTTGSAQNPLTLNRYLYANANPATLVDPDGHAGMMHDGSWQSGTFACDRRLYGFDDCPVTTPRGKIKRPSVPVVPWYQKVAMEGGPDSLTDSIAFKENPKAAIADDAARACFDNRSDHFSREEGCYLHYHPQLINGWGDPDPTAIAMMFLGIGCASGACWEFILSHPLWAAALGFASGFADLLGQAQSYGQPGIDPAEVLYMSLFGAATGGMTDGLSLGWRVFVGALTGIAGSVTWGGVSGQETDREKADKAGALGALCAIFKGKWGVFCSIASGLTGP
jgi:RHS repeat-associated protein